MSTAAAGRRHHVRVRRSSVDVLRQQLVRGERGVEVRRLAAGQRADTAPAQRAGARILPQHRTANTQLPSPARPRRLHRLLRRQRTQLDAGLPPHAVSRRTVCPDAFV